MPLQLSLAPISTTAAALSYLLLLSIPTFSILTSATATATTTPTGDALALLNFKSKADLHDLLPYNTSTSHCNWHGILCAGDESNRVIRLVIRNLNLGGIIPHNSLNTLTELRILSLQNDSLTGPIPDLSNLIHLKFLYLTHNSLTGPFPPSISSLHRIRTIDLSHNNLTGTLPAWLTQLDHLIYLALDMNRFTGLIPALNQSTLQSFNVSSNNLSGAVPVTAALARFGLNSFAGNEKLCGKIVQRECRSKLSFFGPPSSSPAPAVSPRAEVGFEQQNGERKEGRKEEEEEEEKVVVIGLSIGVLGLVGAVVCFVCVFKRVIVRRKKPRHISDEQTVLEVSSNNNNSRIENQFMDKTVAESILPAGSGDESLVFCCKEEDEQRWVYTVEQLMRGSAELLGRGSIGTTYKAVLLENRLTVCVKRLDGSRMELLTKDAFKQHMGTVGGLRHPNLVPLRAYFEGKGERLLVYDYHPNGSLFSLLHGSKSARAKPLHWTSCLKIAEDIAQGLSYIHQAGRLLHGNLKSSNVLLGSDFEACLIDYCLTPLLANHSHSSNSLEHNKAPEENRSDVYSYGVLLLELLSGKLPHQQQPDLRVATKDAKMKWVRKSREISSSSSTKDDGVEDEEGRWLDMLLQVAVTCSVNSPEQRPTMWHALKMLQQIKDAMLMEDG